MASGDSSEKPTGRPVRVAAVDDHVSVRHGVVAMLAGDDRLQVVRTGESVADIDLDHGPDLDVVLLDLNLRDSSTPRGNVARLRAAGLAVVVYSQLTDETLVREALAAGALGVVDKGAEVAELVEVLLTAARDEPHLSTHWAAAVEGDHSEGRPALSARERQALALYTSGLPMKSAARRMGISLGSFREYLLRVRRKYADVDRPAATKLQLYRRAVEDGYDVAESVAATADETSAESATPGAAPDDSSPSRLAERESQRP